MALKGAAERIGIPKADRSGHALDISVREKQLATRLVYPERLDIFCRSRSEGAFENAAKVAQTKTGSVREDLETQVVVQMRRDPGRQFSEAIARATLELGKIERTGVVSKRP
jgi:hypothetical protein